MKYMVGVTINNCFEVEADSEEDAIEQAEKMFWRDTQGWGIEKLELGSVRLQNDA